MRILVTGGAGYIGSHTVELLHRDDHEIIIFDDLSTGYCEAVLHGELVVGDLADDSCLSDLFNQHRFDAVIHFAASLDVKESVSKPLLYYKNNTLNTLRLVGKCCEHGVRYFIFSSSAAVYGEADKSPIDETAPLNPINPYGWSKMMSERMLSDIAPLGGMKYVSLRYYNVAGADPALRLGERGAERLVQTICRAAAGRLPRLEIYGTDYPTPDGTCVRDYIHVTDLADIHIQALDYLTDGGESVAMNCGYGRGFSVREMVDAAKQVIGDKFTVVEMERRPKDPASLVADVGKLSAVLDWKPAFDDITTIIKTAWEWEQQLRQQQSCS